MKKIRDFRKPYRVQKKEPIFRKRFFWIAILILIIFNGLFYFIVFSPVFQIKEIKISNNQDFLVQEIQNKIQNQIKQRILFFPSKSIFLIDLKQIEQFILEQFPKIAEVNLKRKFPNTLEIKIIPRKPVAIFYQNQEYFFIDKQGVIFYPINKIKNFNGTEKILKNGLEIFKIKSLDQQEKLELGETVIKQSLMIKILEIKEKLKKNLEISLKQVSIISNQRIEIQTNENWEIYFNPQNSISQQIFNLEIVLKQKIPLDKRKDLKYIDLRFGNRIFYKYQ